MWEEMGRLVGGLFVKESKWEAPMWKDVRGKKWENPMQEGMRRSCLEGKCGEIHWGEDFILGGTGGLGRKPHCSRI